jgi:hypothetical protein
MSVCHDFPKPVITEVKPWTNYTGMWFCSVCFREFPKKEKHDGCAGRPEDMAACVKSSAG